MKYTGRPDYQHARPEKTGLLITNLGTPDAPTAPALRRYLGEFLWDPRVVEFPRPLWWLILHLIILRIRPRASAKTYARIWTEQGSPLMLHSKAQLAGLREKFSAQGLSHIEVDFAMRYGSPSIESALLDMQAKNITELLVLPLYPQYSGATTASTFDAVARVCQKLRWMPELRFINQYYDNPLYIAACARQIKQYWSSHRPGQMLLFSFHGLPRRYLTCGDPYHCQCHKTARLIAGKLNLPASQWQLSFQSRFGREEWLQPYTDETLQAIGSQGVKSVDVFCPGFSADCVETLEEIDMLNRQVFLSAGGEQFQYIPALNDSRHHLEAIYQLAIKHMQGWPRSHAGYDPNQHAQAKLSTQTRAKSLGATA